MNKNNVDLIVEELESNLKEYIVNNKAIDNISQRIHNASLRIYNHIQEEQLKADFVDYVKANSDCEVKETELKAATRHVKKLFHYTADNAFESSPMITSLIDNFQRSFLSGEQSQSSEITDSDLLENMIKYYKDYADNAGVSILYKADIVDFVEENLNVGFTHLRNALNEIENGDNLRQSDCDISMQAIESFLQETAKSLVFPDYFQNAEMNSSQRELNTRINQILKEELQTKVSYAIDDFLERSENSESLISDSPLTTLNEICQASNKRLESGEARSL